MKLNRLNREPLVTHPLQCSIVQIDRSYFGQALIERIDFDAESMILRRDTDSACLEILDGLVGPSMPELQLVGFSPQNQPKDLMA